MSKIVDNVLADVCLDERVTGGIFKLDEEEHMNALRDYFIKRGLAKESAIQVTNQMVEGRFPERQAYNSDGILVTFPTPKHKANALKRGTHFDKNPVPQPRKENPPEKSNAGVKPLPKINPDPEETPEKDDVDKEEPKDSDDKGTEDKSDLFKKEPEDGNLAVEPNSNTSKTSPAMIQPPVVQEPPRTPERIAAEKEVVKQLINTNDTVVSNTQLPLSENCRDQLAKLYKYADERGLSEAVTFLTKYVNP